MRHLMYVVLNVKMSHDLRVLNCMVRTCLTSIAYMLEKVITTTNGEAI